MSSFPGNLVLDWFSAHIPPIKYGYSHAAVTSRKKDPGPLFFFCSHLLLCTGPPAFFGSGEGREKGTTFLCHCPCFAPFTSFCGDTICTQISCKKIMFLLPSESSNALVLRKSQTMRLFPSQKGSKAGIEPISRHKSSFGANSLLSIVF